MTLRVVLYAEGAGETLGVGVSLPPAPGALLPEESLGAGHIILRRALEMARGIAPAAIRFEAPLRTRGRVATGSDLHHISTHRQLLTWADVGRRPDLAVVLVDRDGDTQRRTQLEAGLAGLPGSKVIAVAVEEFEAWLIADVATVNRVLKSPRSFAGPSDRLARGVAKSELSAWIGESGAPGAGNHRSVRLEIARSIDLGLVARLCAAFADLLADLRVP
jgi:hypothetical protein